MQYILFFLTYYLKQKHQKYKIIKLKSKDCVQKKIWVVPEQLFFFLEITSISGKSMGQTLWYQVRLESLKFKVRETFGNLLKPYFQIFSKLPDSFQSIQIMWKLADSWKKNWLIFVATFLKIQLLKKKLFRFI